MLPAEFLIDYVRVYQDPQDPAQMIGCSPSSHPTAKFIEVLTETVVYSFDRICNK